jgi:ribosomal protein S16
MAIVISLLVWGGVVCSSVVFNVQTNSTGSELDHLGVGSPGLESKKVELESEFDLSPILRGASPSSSALHEVCKLIAVSSCHVMISPWCPCGS